jgi:hypothetical protein
MTRNNAGLTFHLIFYTLHRCLIGSLPVIRLGVFNMTQKQNARACSGKHRIHRTHGESTVLFGNADKVTGICSEEKTRALA